MECKIPTKLMQNMTSEPIRFGIIIEPTSIDMFGMGIVTKDTV